MRERSRWHLPLSKRLKELLENDPQPCTPVLFCQVELGLTLLKQIAPEETAGALWGLLTGHIILDEKGKREKLARVRHVLPFGSRYVWEKALENYKSVELSLRLYSFEGDGFERREVSLCAGRIEHYQRVLSHPLPYSQREVLWAETGSYTFFVKQQPYEIALAEAHFQEEPEKHPLRQDKCKPPITVAWKALRQTAIQMDEQDALAARAPRNWEKRISKVRWQIYDRGLLLESETFTLEAMCHVIGMVSSGKSTLMDVLAVHIAKQKKRVTVVLNDVVSVLERVELYERYGVGAAPMLGKSDRIGHNNRLHRTQRSLSSASRDPRARWVSPFCPLDALTGAAKPLELKDAPCQTLIKVEKEPKKHPKRYCCPLWRACPRFEADRHLVNATIWVATPASLVYAGVPKQQNRESLRYLELALRQSDLVIVDEADRVQRGLDQIFAPNQVIVDREGRSLLGGLQAKVNPILDQKGRSQLKNREVESWVMLHDVAQIASKRLYALVYQNTNDLGQREGDLKRYLGTLPFNGVTLSQRLVKTWFGEEEDAGGLLSHLEKVINDPLGEKENGELTEISRELLTYSSFTPTRSKLEDFLETHTKLQGEQREKAAIKLELFLLTCILTNRLEKLLSQWPHIEGVLTVDNELSGRPPRDYIALVPTSPMGNILALQFTQVDEGLGDLRYLRCAGVGRYLLLNLHELFIGDEFANPHVLLLSGTSWAGASPNYHVQVPVTGVLRAPDEEVTAIAKSRFEFTSLGGGPVRISGSRGGVREDALAELIHRLMRQSDISGRSLLDAHLNELPESRQRALVLTGSYEETEHVFREICRVRPDWQNEVRFLQADKDGDKGEKQVLWYGQDRGLRRGVVDTFATTGAKVLVAPLLAVERGHNILNSEGYAAIGAAYLLVRPHPRPNELDYALHSINRWAVDELQKPVEGSLEQAAKDKRRRAFQRWIGLLKTQLRYADLADKKPDQVAVTWNLLVPIWQVIGRLVRGGQAAHVYFCDGAFMPRREDGSLDGEASLLLNMLEVLRPYCEGDAEDAELVKALYSPLYHALSNLKGVPNG